MPFHRDYPVRPGIAALPVDAALPPAHRRLTLALPRWLPLLSIFLVAVTMRGFTLANLDTSWCLTMAEKVLDGQRLYVDIIDVNPPATVFLFIVPAMLGRLSGIPAEYIADALVFLAAALSLWLCGRILRPVGLSDQQRWTLATLCAAALLILPAYTFGEREHIALILFLPVLATAAVRARRAHPDLLLAIVTGVCGGIVAIIKPHFAIPIVCVSAVAALHARSWRPLFALENWIAAALLAVYVAVVVFAYPEFISDILPMAMVSYLPSKTPYLIMLEAFATPCWVAAVILTALLKRRAMVELPYSLLLAGSVGFFIEFYVQQKGWNYHSYPMLALALIALMMALIEQWREHVVPPAVGRLKRLSSAFAAAVIVAVAQTWLSICMLDPRPLAQAVEAVKAHPKIMVLSDVLCVSFPLTRMVGGTFVGRASQLWVTGTIWYRRKQGLQDPKTEALLDHYIARDKAMFAEDVAKNRPDVIIVDKGRDLDWMGWANSYPPLAAEMKLYEKFKTVGDFDVLRRRPGS